MGITHQLPLQRRWRGCSWHWQPESSRAVCKLAREIWKERNTQINKLLISRYPFALHTNQTWMLQQWTEFVFLSVYSDYLWQEGHSLRLEDHRRHHAHKHNTEDRVVKLHRAFNGQNQHARNCLHSNDCDWTYAPSVQLNPKQTRQLMPLHKSIGALWTKDGYVLILKTAGHSPSNATCSRITTR